MEPRYSKNGVRITEKQTVASRRNIQKCLAKRRAYSAGKTPLPDDGVVRSRDGRILTEKWLKANRETSAKMKGKRRVTEYRRRICREVEFPVPFLERLNEFVGGKYLRVRFIEKFISDRIDADISKGITPEEVRSSIPVLKPVPGGTPVRVVLLHPEFLEKVNAHVGDKHLRVRYMVHVITEHMDSQKGNV